MKKNEDVFLVSDKKIKGLTSEHFNVKHSSNLSRDTLKSIIGQNPHVLPSHRMVRDNIDPPFFLKIAQEFKIGIWELDYLFIDQYGVLTIIDTNLIDNPEASRVAIGRIIDYAATISDEWDTDHLKSFFQESEAVGIQNPENYFRNNLGFNHPSQDFWQLVHDNLKMSRIRIVVLAEQIRDDLKRMLEFLNEHLKSTHVFGLELKFYKNTNEDSLLLLPQLIGNTQSILNRKTFANKTFAWNQDSVYKKAKKISNQILQKRILKILDFAIDKNLYIQGTTKSSSPSFGLKGKAGERLFTFYLNGEIEIFMHQINQMEDIKKRDELLMKLKKQKLVASDFSIQNSIKKPYLENKLQEMSESVFRNFLSMLSAYYGEILL
ncbi:MAG: hypothetical protein ACQES9_10845 [Myxococcota bacterium]